MSRSLEKGESPLLAVRVPESLLKAIDKLAKKSKLGRPEMVRVALNNFVQSNTD